MKLQSVEIDIQENELCAACGNHHLSGIVFVSTPKKRKGNFSFKKNKNEIQDETTLTVATSSEYVQTGEPFKKIDMHNDVDYTADSDSSILAACGICHTVKVRGENNPEGEELELKCLLLAKNFSLS